MDFELSRVPQVTIHVCRHQEERSDEATQEPARQLRSAGPGLLRLRLLMNSASDRPFGNRLRESYRPSAAGARPEEHTSDLQSLMRLSYAVFCLKKKK